MTAEKTTKCWPAAPLAELIVDATNGLASGERDPAGTLQIRMNNVGTDGSLDLVDVIRIPASSGQVSRYCLQAGDVLFNNTNSTELVGKSTLFPGHNEPVLFSNHFTRLRTNRDRLCPSYLARWLTRQQQAQVFGRLCNRWVNQSAVRKESLLALTIPLPPLSEQERIAAILDQADVIRRRRTEALDTALGLKESLFLEMFGDPMLNPKHWPRLSFGDRITLLQYGPRFYNEAYTPSGVRIVRITDLDFQGHLNFEAMPKLDVFKEDRERYRLLPGDLLLARSGATVGKTALIADDAPDCIAGAYFIRMRFAADVHPLYAQMILRSRSVQSLITEKSRQSAQQNFNGPAIRSLPLPLAPRAMQDSFVDRCRQAERLAGRINDHANESSRLFACLAHRAFRGEL